jgi:hypothetical protein
MHFLQHIIERIYPNEIGNLFIEHCAVSLTEGRGTGDGVRSSRTDDFILLFRIFPFSHFQDNSRNLEFCIDI